MPPPATRYPHHHDNHHRHLQYVPDDPAAAPTIIMTFLIIVHSHSYNIIDCQHIVIDKHLSHPNDDDHHIAHIPLQPLIPAPYHIYYSHHPSMPAHYPSATMSALIIFRSVAYLPPLSTHYYTCSAASCHTQDPVSRAAMNMCAPCSPYLICDWQVVLGGLYRQQLPTSRPYSTA